MSIDACETADIETSSDDYAARFSGPVGNWMLEVQEKITLGLLEDTPGVPILDVGGGHGQLAIPLCRNNFSISVLGSSESCRKRISGIVDTGKCTFTVGNVTALPFPDRSFDTVISFRLLTHCEQWPKLISELCRVARHSVIVDYPTSQSLNRIAPFLFKAKKKLEGDTRRWTLFKHDDVLREFVKHDFALKTKTAQFFLPLVLHRTLKCRALSVLLESLCTTVGLTHLWGSPIILKAVRTEDRGQESGGRSQVRTDHRVQCL